MSLRKTRVVDWLGIEKGTGAVLLTAIDDEDWREEDEHVRLLQDKLNAYLAFIESGEVFERLADDVGQVVSPNTAIKIRILAKHSLPRGADAFLKYAADMIERAGFSLDHRVLAAQPPPDDASAASRPRDEGPAVVSKAAAQLVLASGDVPRVCETLVSVALNEPDWRWAQERCLAFTAHSDARVRAVAARSLGHLARIHGQLDLDAVMSRLKVLFEDAETAGYAEAAIEDVERFILRTP